MTNTLASPQLGMVLGRLFEEASRDDDLDEPALPSGRSAWAEVTAAERSDAFADYYIPISAEAGKLLYAVARAIRPRTVVEFGTSFGISTLFLAAALTDNGTGHVVTTELSKRKAVAARANLDEAGVGEVVTVLCGDAMETLDGVRGPVELVFLDGWKDLCLPVLRLLEPKLAPGALVAADDITHSTMAEYLDYVRNAANGYVTVAFPVEDGLEISSWTGTTAP
ncbi:MAG TPA: class I SAM-dependent methyltransferase [Acidimicrobiales bacterium]|nr:class I SAM-dependent methyltransferase [Acidimicrobiales bacterium]